MWPPEGVSIHAAALIIGITTHQGAVPHLDFYPTTVRVYLQWT